MWGADRLIGGGAVGLFHASKVFDWKRRAPGQGYGSEEQYSVNVKGKEVGPHPDMSPGGQSSNLSRQR